MGANLRDPHTGRPVPEIPVDTNLFGPSTQTVIFATDHGPVDVAFRPDGTNGYDDLNRNATTIVFRGEPIRRLHQRRDQVQDRSRPCEGPRHGPRLRTVRARPPDATRATTWQR